MMTTAGVFAAMFHAVLTYRRTENSRYFHRSAALELIWAAVPCLMFVACAAPAAKLILALPNNQPELTQPLQ
jgi:heme/copper-type cytochrome/quinol oxidase subunit 2